VFRLFNGVWTDGYVPSNLKDQRQSDRNLLLGFTPELYWGDCTEWQGGVCQHAGIRIET